MAEYLERPAKPSQKPATSHKRQTAEPLAPPKKIVVRGMAAPASANEEGHPTRSSRLPRRERKTRH